MGSFLFVTWTGGGNIHPLLAIAKRLREHGHEVRVLGPSPLADRVEGAGLELRAQQSATAAELADEVIAEGRRTATDALVVDYMLPYALSGAEVLGLPVAALVHTLYQRVAIAERTPMAMTGAPDAVNAVRERLGLPAIRTLPALLDRCDRVLVVTPVELDRPVEPVASNVRFVGPVREDAGADASWSPPWAASDVPLVHVSMGTVPPDEMAMPVIQRALDALADLPVHVFVTLPGRADRPWKGSTDADVDALAVPANARVSGYVRHAAVLPHTQLFITHAGLGSVGAALTHGVPMVCVPLFLEQPDNAAQVEAIGAGRALAPDASVDDLRVAVVDVLEDHRYREVVEPIADRLRADDPGAIAVRELEHLLSR